MAVRPPLRDFWIHLYRKLWSVLMLIWIAIVLALVLDVVFTVLTIDTDFPPHLPLEWLGQHFFFIITLGIIFLLLTILVGVTLYRNTPPVPLDRDFPIQETRHALIRLLNRVYREQRVQSLHEAAIISLGLLRESDVLANPWHLTLQQANQPTWILPEGMSITEAYDEAGDGLLILGEPGTGKTTLLFELANGLLVRAENDLSHPIPVIVNLSSWAIKRLPIATWLIEQLQLLYMVPPSLGRALLGRDQLLILLDGLDEVEASARSECIAAINTYRIEHRVPLVVCSRSQEYLRQQPRLALSHAIMVQRLNETQIDAYLASAGRQLEALRTALRSDSLLHELATTPLMLSILILTYRGKSIEDLPAEDSPEMRHQEVFARYVQQMLKQRNHSHYTPLQTRRWLSWLAHHMKQRQLTEFYLDHLQPTWLSTKSSRILYALLWVLVIGLAIGLVITRLHGLVGGLVGGLVEVLVSGLVFVLPIELSSIELPFGLSKKIQAMRPAQTQLSTWEGFVRELVIVLVSVLIGVLAGGRVGILIGGLVGGRFGGQLGKVIGVLVGALVGMRIGRWAIGWIAVEIGGWMVSRIGGWFGGQISGWVIVRTGRWIVAQIKPGLFSERISERLPIEPNQAIQSTGRRALRIGIMGVLVSMLVSVLLSVHGIFSLLTVGLAVGLSFGLVYGGAVYINHYVLRFIFWRIGVLPWNYSDFLDYATDRCLLRKIGGGYIFIHRLLLEYFDSLETAPTSDGVIE